MITVLSAGSTAAGGGVSIPTDLVVPLMTAVHEYTATTSTTANDAVACRCVMPKAGTLKDLYILGGAGTGNYIGVVFDTGNTTGGSATNLWNGSTVANATAWTKLGDPNIAVTAGQHLDLGFIVDASTTFCKSGSTALAAGLGIPTALLAAAGGLQPKLGWRAAGGAFSAPASVTEANRIAVQYAPAILARIS